MCSSTPKTIKIGRSIYDNSSSIRSQFNYLSSFIDGSNIYGAFDDRARALRTLSGFTFMITNRLIFIINAIMIVRRIDESIRRKFATI